MSILNESTTNKMSPMAALYFKHYVTIFNICSPALQRRLRGAVNNDTETPPDVMSLIRKIVNNAEAEYDELIKPKQLGEGKVKIPVE